MTARLLVGDCREVLAAMAANSIDACVTDPPYGLSREPNIVDVLTHWLNGDDYRHSGNGFMGKSWDSFVPGPSYWREVYRVLKPGAHLLSFGGTRTFDLLTIALRIAGFEIRDTLLWVTGQGFPKSLSVSKALDKAAGAEREVVSSFYRNRDSFREMENRTDRLNRNVEVTAPATDLARQWDGWGTALKPGVEMICLARKPLSGSVAANVTAWGVGGLNIDGCRIEHTPGNEGVWGAKSKNPGTSKYGGDVYFASVTETDSERNPLGRWPANLILDAESAALLDELSGERTAGSPKTGNEPHAAAFSGNLYGAAAKNGVKWDGYGDTGGASRFFYTSKASRLERTQGGASGKHPTQKPIDLMQWLCRLICPPNGTILDPFAGSGTTGVAADREGFHSILIEQSAEYAEDARRKIIGDAPLFAEVVTP